MDKVSLAESGSSSIINNTLTRLPTVIQDSMCSEQIAKSFISLTFI